MPQPPEGPTPNAQPPLTGMPEALERARADLAAANIALSAAHSRAEALDAELQHRVRNVLAVIRSIFSRTVGTAQSLEHMSDHFQGRLDAIARYQPGAASSFGYDVEDMMNDTLMTYAALGDPRVTIGGPEVRLNGRTAESIGLALHELATNSVKFGMLAPACERGRLEVRWQKRAGQLALEWTETGITVLTSAPMRIGFGREFIEQGLPYQLGGETSFELSAGRLRCTIAVPLSDRDPSF